MMLSDKQIIHYRQQGKILISNFTPKQLGSNSYDVRLGPYYWLPDPTSEKVGAILDPYDENDVRQYWTELVDARVTSKSYTLNKVVIPPMTTILGHTIERIGGVSEITTSMRTRSSVGRISVSGVKCAGVGDVGYTAHWTMEITNHTNRTVVLPVGMRITQVEFYFVGETLKKYDGKYGKTKLYQHIVEDSELAGFDPYDMLPKLYNDWDYCTDCKVIHASR